MKPRWKRRLDAARRELLEQGPRIVVLLSTPHPVVQEAMDDLLTGVGWRRSDYYNHYFELLMRENRRG